VNDFVEGFIACETRVVHILDIAETDASPLVQAFCAALHMFAESGRATANAAPFIARAQAGLADGSVSARERRLRGGGVRLGGGRPAPRHRAARGAGA